jgi:6-phosphogluconolactonase (cycloisomerase 2 family)
MVTAYLAVSDPDGNQIRAFRVRDDGPLEPVAGVAAVSAPDDAMLAVHPSGRFLYAATQFDRGTDGYGPDDPRREKATGSSRGKSDIRVYAVGEGGALTLAQTVTFANVARALLVSPTGKLLLAPCALGRVAVFRIGPDGRLTAAGETKVTETFGLTDVAGERDGWDGAFSTDGKFYFNFVEDGFTDHAEDYLTSYRVGPDGRLRKAGTDWAATSEGTKGGDAGPVHFTPDGRRAFVDGSGGVGVYRHVAGRLTRLQQRLLVLPKLASGKSDEYTPPYSVAAIDPRGRYVYACPKWDADDHPCAAYTVGAGTSAPTRLTAAFPSPGQDVPLFAEPGGRFVYVVRHTEPPQPTAEGEPALAAPPDVVTAYAVGTGGKLTPVSAAPLAVRGYVRGMVFVPAGKGR